MTTRASRAVAAVVALVATAAGCARREPQRHTVRIAQMRFVPEDLAVHPGDIVEWVNEDLVAHTVASADAALTSGPIAPGGAWRWTVDGADPIRYVCTLHPTMKAQLEVR